MIIKCPVCESELATNAPGRLTRDIEARLTTIREEARRAAFKDLEDLDLRALLHDLEAADDYLTCGPWEASEAAKQPFAVRIGNDQFVCPEGSAQIRADEPGVRHRCLVPYGVIHYSDAEGIVLMRNRLEETIRVVAAALEAAEKGERDD